jgi:hypothetical protein
VITSSSLRFSSRWRAGVTAARCAAAASGCPNTAGSRSGLPKAPSGVKPSGDTTM